MKLAPCLLLLWTLSMSVTGVPLQTTHDAHHHHPQHNLNMTEHQANQANQTIHVDANHTEGRQLLVSIALAPAPAFKISSVLSDWLKTPTGASAATFCTSLGIQNNVDVYSGCLEDMRVTKSEAIAKESAITAMEFASKDKVVSPSNRFCVASGDPHCTNYDGDFFHIQEPGIYTIATSRDGVFEVQEKMRKNGDNKVGVPSCMTGALVHYKQISIEVDVENFKKFRLLLRRHFVLSR